MQEFHEEKGFKTIEMIGTWDNLHILYVVKWVSREMFHVLFFYHKPDIKMDMRIAIA